MDSEEFGWHLADHRRELWGEERSDLRMGLLLANWASTKDGRQHRPAEFMPYVERDEPQPQSEADMKATAESFFRVCARRKGRGGETAER